MSKPDTFCVPGGEWIRCSPTKVVDGVARQTFKKAIVKAGRFVRGSASGQPFELTEANLDHWAVTFADMAAAGIEVPIPKSHEDANKSEHNRGFVRSMFREGDTLYALAEMIGEDAIRDAARNNVSIFAPESWTDSKGKTWTWPIQHVALTPHPIVTGLGPFVPIEMSEPHRGKAMLEFLKKLGEKLGIDAAKLTEEKAATELVLSEIGTLAEKAKTKPEPKKDDPKPEPKGDLALADSPTFLSTVAENRTLKIDTLFKAGKIDKPTADKLREQYAKPEAISLAMKGGNSEEFERVVKLLGDNAPVKTGSATGPQLIELGDKLKDGDKSILEKQAEAIAADAEKAERAKRN